MHKANEYIKTLFPSSRPNNAAQVIKSYRLNKIDEREIMNRLHNDAVSYIYSSTVSVADAIRGIRGNLFTWATVKLYYAAFYSCRAILAIDDICIFYMYEKPYIIEVKAGNSPKTPPQKERQTHTIVLNEFKRQNKQSFLCLQDIDNDFPLEWLKKKREEANYKRAKFQEPDTPTYFKEIKNYGIRQALRAYLQDSKDIYLFNTNYAMVAYPIGLLQYAYDMLENKNLKLVKKDKKYLCQLFKDEKGQKIPEIYTMISRD